MPNRKVSTSRPTPTAATNEDRNEQERHSEDRHESGKAHHEDLHNDMGQGHREECAEEEDHGVDEHEVDEREGRGHIEVVQRGAEQVGEHQQANPHSGDERRQEREHQEGILRDQDRHDKEHLCEDRHEDSSKAHREDLHSDKEQGHQEPSNTRKSETMVRTSFGTMENSAVAQRGARAGCGTSMVLRRRPGNKRGAGTSRPKTTAMKTAGSRRTFCETTNETRRGIKTNTVRTGIRTAVRGTRLRNRKTASTMQKSRNKKRTREKSATKH